MQKLGISTKKRIEFVDVSAKLSKAVSSSGIKKGMLFLYVPHTTAGLTVNENADPSVHRDINNKMNRLVPEGDGFTHMEGNSDSHIKSSLFGNELFFFIENGVIVLGTWQGIYFCEFDGPRQRELFFRIVKE